MSFRATPVLLLAAVATFAACKRPASDASGVKENPAGATAGTGDACDVDPQKLADQLFNAQGYVNLGPARKVVEAKDDDLAQVCQGSAAANGIAGASDPVCRAYCDTCTSTLPEKAKAIFGYLASPLNVARLFASYGDKVGFAQLSGSIAVLYDFLDTRLKVDKALGATFCASSLFDLANTLYTWNEAGSVASEKFTRALCYVNAAFNSCDVIPGVGPLVTQVKTKFYAVPVLAAAGVGLSVSCTAGILLADKVVKCPAYKAACLGILRNAQPIDNTACCACGIKHQGTGDMSQYWGGRVYAGADDCEMRDDASVRRAFPKIPPGGEAVCRRIPIDRVKTRSCSFQTWVPGSVISCWKDREVYCVDRPIYTEDGRTLRAVTAPILQGCTRYITPEDLIAKATSYVTLRPVTITVKDHATESANPAPAGGAATPSALDKTP